MQKGTKGMAEIAYKQLAKKRRKKRIKRITCIVLAVLVLLAGVYLLCTVRHVEVVGNETYSASQIEKAVLPSRLDYNTIYLLYQIHYGHVQTPPYLDLAEIEIVSFNSIRIHAYERTIMSGVQADGSYIYFDQDGIVLEITDAPKEEISIVSGLQFDKAVLYEELPVKDETVFQSLVNLMQLLRKNGLVPDAIAVTDADEFDVTFGEVVVHLGKDASMDNKIARLAAMMPTLTGKCGDLDMRDVDVSTERITFTKRKTQAQLDAEAQAAQAQEDQKVKTAEQAAYDEAYQQALWDAEWCEENGEEYDWDAFYAQYGDGSESGTDGNATDGSEGGNDGSADGENGSEHDNTAASDYDGEDSDYAAAYQQALWDAEWCEENGEKYDWDAFHEQYGYGE